MSKTFKDDKPPGKRKEFSEGFEHEEYIRHKKEKHLKNALRSCDIERMVNEDLSNI